MLFRSMLVLMLFASLAISRPSGSNRISKVPVPVAVADGGDPMPDWFAPAPQPDLVADGGDPMPDWFAPGPQPDLVADGGDPMPDWFAPAPGASISL